MIPDLDSKSQHRRGETGYRQLNWRAGSCEYDEHKNESERFHEQDDEDQIQPLLQIHIAYREHWLCSNRCPQP